jgi:hypothetical protein
MSYVQTYLHSLYINIHYNFRYTTSLYISLILAVLNLMGYVVITTFLAITEVPIIIRQLDDYVEDSLSDITMREEEYRDAGAFKWWFVTLVNICFHKTNYKSLRTFFKNEFRKLVYLPFFC